MTMKQEGFNLVELMIALVVGIVLMTSITTMFVDTKVSANRSSTVSSLQQQAQLALQVLVEDVRSIGSWAEFSGGGFTHIPPVIAAAGCNIQPPASSANSTNWIAAGANVTVDNNCLGLDFDVTGDSDIFFIARIRGVIIPVADVVLNSSRHYVAISPMQAQLFTGVVPKIENAEIYPYVHNTYFVQNHADEGTRLSRFSFVDGVFTNDLVVGNIEKIRIDFGIDTNNDGRADKYSKSQSIIDVNWSNNSIVAARIYVLARAKNKDLTLNNNAEYNKRFSPFTPTSDDNYRRFLLSTTVVIKNHMMAVAQ
ncbi:MAG: type IV pilus assembly protein PilW [Moritella dasanensis]|jgi:type IV pilus assembly protein PilW